MLVEVFAGDQFVSDGKLDRNVVLFTSTSIFSTFADLLVYPLTSALGLEAFYIPELL